MGDEIASLLHLAIYTGAKGAICHTHVQRVAADYLAYAAHYAPIREGDNGETAAQHCHGVE
jgi:hypothetical protein